MGAWFESVTDLAAGADALRRRRHGVIDMRDGHLHAVHLRPWPKYISEWEIRLFGARAHARRPGDRCLLYYKQPWGSPDFLTLIYTVSHRDAQYATCRGGLRVLDEIARLKGSQAAVTALVNERVTDRSLERVGWTRHCLNWSGRHFIRRYYGEFPTLPENLRRRPEVGITPHSA